MAGPLGALVAEWLVSLIVALSGVLWFTAMTAVALPMALLRRALLPPAGPKTFQSILITGASSGIGAGLAKAYARPGASLVLTARRADKLAVVKEACEAKGAAVKVVCVDVTDQKAMEAAILEADRDLPLDLVIANAGVDELSFCGKGDSFLSGAQVPVFGTNIMGVVHTVSPIIDRMRARRSGQIVIMASQMSVPVVPLPCWAAYSSSKIWARAYGLALRGSVQADGVGVTTLCPGFTVSEMTEQAKAHNPSARGLMESIELSTDTAVARMVEAVASDVAVFYVPFNLSLASLIAVGFNIVPPGMISSLRPLWDLLRRDQQQGVPPSSEAAGTKKAQ